MNAADEPAPSALGQQRADAVVGGATFSCERVVLRGGKDVRVRRERLNVFVDVGAKRRNPRLCLDRG